MVKYVLFIKIYLLIIVSEVVIDDWITLNKCMLVGKKNHVLVL